MCFSTLRFTIFRATSPFLIQEGNKTLLQTEYTPPKENVPMEQTLPLPFFQPSPVVLTKIRQFARTFRPQPYSLTLA